MPDSTLTGSLKGAGPWIWKDVEGKSFDELDDKQSKLTVVVFVSTDCPVANALLPALREIQSEFADKGVQFLQVHPTARTTIEKA